MVKRLLPLLLLLLAGAICGWLVWDEIEASGVFGRSGADGGEHGARYHDGAQASGVIAEEGGVRLRGLPGVRTAKGGVGRVVGEVSRHLPGVGAAPFPGVKVRLVGGTVRPAQETDAEGAFLFEGVEADHGYALVVDHPPFKEVVLRGLGVRRDRTTDVGRILLGGPTALTGEVVDAAGRGVAGASVQVLFDRGRHRRMDVRRAIFDLQAAMDPLAEARARSDGRFHVESLPAGRYLVRVSAPGYATAFRSGVWVTSDERAPALQVVLDRGAGFEGRVADQDGHGLAEARVIAVAMATGDSRRLDRVETTTGADGRYRLDSLVSGTRYFLEAWAEGFAPAGRITQPAEVESLDFTLVASGRVEGRITDAATSAGIPNAEVTMVAGTVNTLSPVATVTDADGRYVLEHVSAGPIMLWAAKAAGYPAESFDLGSAAGRKVVAGETTIIDQALDPGCVVFGQITDVSGSGVAYATVAFANPRRRAEGEETGFTDVDGNYRVEGLRATTYEIHIIAPGFAPLEEETATVEVAEGVSEVRHDVTLAYGATLSGTVVDPYGAPVGGARLELVASDNRRAQARVQDLVAVTAANGVWRIAGVPPRAPIVVRASHDMWVAAESVPLRLQPGELRNVPLALGAGVQLVGRVTDDRKRAVSGARVRWGSVEGARERDLRDEFRADQLLTPRVIRTDGDGAFTIPGLPPGRLLLKVEQEGYADWIRSDLTVPAEGAPAPVAVALMPALSLAGRVRDEVTGRPIAEAWIYAQEASAPEEEVPDAGRVKALLSAQTDASGKYVIPGVAPDRAYEVVVWMALGYTAEVQDRKDARIRRENVEPGAQNVDFALAPVSDGN